MALNSHKVTRILTTTVLLSSTAVLAMAAGSSGAALAATACVPADAFAATKLTRDGVSSGPDASGAASVTGDFNGDGYTDAAVGAPGLRGKVFIYHGSANGLSQQSVLASSGDGGIENFGSALAVGDFNGDGKDDLAAGLPGFSLDTGKVRYWRGSATGLNPSGTDITQQFASEAAEAGDRFGSSLAAGDFNGDGKDDLAIGADEEGVGDIGPSGEVTVVTGNASGVLARGWIIKQAGLGQTAKAGDEFGISLAAGNLVGDAKDDLVVGARGKDIGTDTNTGAVFILNGAGNKTTSNPIFRSQGGSADEAADQFGSAATIGDFNKDGTADLAVGVPNESYTSGTHRGMVEVFAGPVTATSAGYFVSPSTLRDSTEDLDRFGAGLRAGDVDRDGYADLLVSATGTVRNGLAGAGSVALFHGRSGQLRPERILFQRDIGATDAAADYFGVSTALGDFNKDGRTDAVIGASGKDSYIGTRVAIPDLGAAYVLDGLNPATVQSIEQNAPFAGVQTAPVGSASGPIRYAYVDRNGGPRILTQTDPDNPSSVQRASDGPADAVLTGKPAIGQTSDQKGVVAARSVTGDLWMRTEVTAGSPAWGPWVNYGGPDLTGITMATAANNRLVVFGVGARGELSVLPQLASGQFGAWQSTGIGNIKGNPVTAVAPDGLQIFATDTDGNVQTALWNGTTLTGCATVGDRTIIGTPSVVSYPGSRLRLFGTTADGALITIAQDLSRVFAPAWSTVQEGGVAGSPAAIYDRNSGRTTVLALATDSTIWGTTESAQTVGEFGPWEQKSPTESRTDVTAVPYTGQGGDAYAYAFRNANGQELFILQSYPSLAAAKAGKATFTQKVLPKY